MCDIKNGESKAVVLYRDDALIVALRDAVVAPGQVTVFPVSHYTIFEQVPDALLEKCSVAANKVSMAVFEQLGAQGTN
ncbi:MAG: HIT domain-containing protein, partial [Nanoarchaeota archaeon]